MLDVPSLDEAQAARYYGEQIGRGAYRTVYRLPGSRWVYKFQNDGWAYNTDSNAHEFHNYSTKRETLPQGVDFPEMHLLGNVIAAEYVDGVLAMNAHESTWKRDGYTNICNCESHRASQCWQKAISTINMKDLHGRNVMIRKDGKILIIDIGEYGNES